MVFGLPEPPKPKEVKGDDNLHTVQPDPRFPNQNQTRWPMYVACGLAGAIIGGVATWYTSNQDNPSTSQMQTKRPTVKPPIEKLPIEKPPNENDQHEDPTCVICLTQKREVILLPCGHVCLCRNCSGIMRNKNCPMCRKNIKHIQAYYMA